MCELRWVFLDEVPQRDDFDCVESSSLFTIMFHVGEGDRNSLLRDVFRDFAAEVRSGVADGEVYVVGWGADKLEALFHVVDTGVGSEGVVRRAGAGGVVEKFINGFVGGEC